MDYRKKLFSITISPRHRRGSDLFLYSGDKYIIRKLLNMCTDYYLIYPELDDSDRLHYHGIILVKDPIKWYRSVKRRLGYSMGFLKMSLLKTFQDRLKWMLYMKKDWSINEEVFESPILPLLSKRRRRSGARAKRLKNIK